MQHILICDDEKDIVSALEIYLTAEGYVTHAAYNGDDALQILEKQDIHLVLMDVMMPHMDGITALSILRRKYNVPVILLTAKSEDNDKILGLNVGADDYITKPFNPVEVIARVRSQLRRYFRLGSVAHSSSLVVGGIVLDDEAKTVTVDGNDVHLTPFEYDILKLLMQSLGKVFSPLEIYREIRKEDPLGAENTIAVHICHLREKIEVNPAEPRYIKVVWGKGYKMEGTVK